MLTFELSSAAIQFKPMPFIDTCYFSSKDNFDFIYSFI